MIIQCFVALLCLVLTFVLIFLSYAQLIWNISTTEIIYCFFVTLEPSSLLFFKQRGSMNLESVLCRSFQVDPCLLQIISVCFLLTIGRIMFCLSSSRLFQVVSGCFLLVVGRFRSFPVLVSAMENIFFPIYWQNWSYARRKNRSLVCISSKQIIF